jgi:hypothetical protein
MILVTSKDKVVVHDDGHACVVIGDGYHHTMSADEHPVYLLETDDGKVIAPWDAYPRAYPEVWK